MSRETYKEAVDTARDIDILDNVMIQTVTTQLSFKSLMLALERRDLIVPDFQRMYRWTEEQAEELAISLVRGMPIPPIYCYTNKELQKVILDGQQRILSLYFYYIGKFMKKKKNAFIDIRKLRNQKIPFLYSLEEYGLKDKKYYMEYKKENGEVQKVNITYETLSDQLKRKIDFNPITIVEINVDSEKYRERTLHKIFANLNIGGIPLSRQELRNGIYSCQFYNMLYEVNDTSEKWRYLFSGKKNADINKQSKDVETLLAMCAFEYYTEGENEEFVLTNYKGKKYSLLDDFSEKVQNFDEDMIDRYKGKLLSFFGDLERVKANGKESLLVSLFVVWNRMKLKPVLSEEKCRQISEDGIYKSTIGSGTTQKVLLRRDLGEYMSCYHNMIKKVTNLICDNQKENNNYILVGDNSSGKSEILQSVIERKKDGAVYFIDSVNRTFKVNDVELAGKSYENMNFDLSQILEMRLNPLNFNLQDTFGVVSCIERLYAKYEEQLIRMCKEFLGKDIHIEKEIIEEVGLTENIVIVDGEKVKLSSGYQAILRLFCEIKFFSDAMKVNNWERGLLVIDEIDEYLSPKYSAKILNYLQNQFPDLNFLVTTHSLDLVKSTKNMNLIVIGESEYQVWREFHWLMSGIDIEQSKAKQTGV